METKTQSIKQRRKATTDIVLKLRETTKIDNLAELVGVSKVTLYTRLRTSNWKKPEMTHVEGLKARLDN